LIHFLACEETLLLADWAIVGGLLNRHNPDVLWISEINRNRFPRLKFYDCRFTDIIDDVRPKASTKMAFGEKSPRQHPRPILV